MITVNTKFKTALADGIAAIVFPDKGWRCELLTGDRIDPDAKPERENLLAFKDGLDFDVFQNGALTRPTGGSFQNVALEEKIITWFRMEHDGTGFVVTGTVGDNKSYDLIVPPNTHAGGSSNFCLYMMPFNFPPYDLRTKFKLITQVFIERFKKHWRSVMKKLLAVLVLAFLADPAIAVAEVKLDFKDGTSTVWSAYYERGAQYCTDLGYGEYCVRKVDVKRVAEVAEGTEGSEYSVSAVGDEQAAKRREEYGQVLNQGEAQARRDQKAKRDRDMKASEGQIFKKKPAW